MDATPVDSDMENTTPETRYFKMMMEDNEIGRVIINGGDDNDSIIGGQTIASLMNDGNAISMSDISKNVDAKESETVEIISQSNNANTMAIVGYDDVDSIATDTVNEVNEITKAFFAGNADRKDSKPRIRLFKEYKNKEYKTPEKKKRGDEDDEQTQPETPPGMIQVPSGDSHSKTKGFMPGKHWFLSLRTKRVYIIAGVLAVILFVSIIALAVALQGVRGRNNSSSATSSSPVNEGNEILESSIDVEAADSNDDKESMDIADMVTQVPVTSPEIDTIPEDVTPTPQPTMDPLAFDNTMKFLIDRGAILSEDIATDSPEYYATAWLSQDPNYSEYTEDRLVQRWSLAMIAQSLDASEDSLRRLQSGKGSDLLPGWMTYTDECTWFSKASPCDKDGMYERIDLKHMMLGGTVPSELALLSNSLQHIALDGNELSGSIPENLQDLTNLVTLRLRRNKLDSDIKIDFGELANLEILDLGKNRLTGVIPYDMLYLNSPTEIRLDSNKLSGNIPWEIGNLSTLEVLALSDNNLSGWIPDSLAELEKLKILTLGNNELTGELPYYGICDFKDLEVLSVDCNDQECECCTECASTNIPTQSPTTLSTPTPTISPTVSPSKPPSPSPVENPPTRAPTECVDELSVLDFCFAPGVGIEISFTNCDPEQDDWVGIYPVDDDFDGNDLPNPMMWSWSCGTRNCREPVSESTFSLDNAHAGGNVWPLDSGIYIAVLARNTGQPYTAYALSDTFVVATQC